MPGLLVDDFGMWIRSVSVFGLGNSRRLTVLPLIEYFNVFFENFILVYNVIGSHACHLP